MTLAARIREAAKDLKEFRRRAISDYIGVMSLEERRKVFEGFKNFIKRGEFERIGPGLYRYAGREEKQTYRQRFWDIARRMVYFSLNDLEQITEGKRDTIKEFCYWMIRKGYAQRVGPGRFKVIGRLKPTVPKYSKRKECFNEGGKPQR